MSGRTRSQKAFVKHSREESGDGSRHMSLVVRWISFVATFTCRREIVGANRPRSAAKSQHDLTRSNTVRFGDGFEAPDHPPRWRGHDAPNSSSASSERPM